ncbi:THUMP domain-containing protein [Thiohalomonas denitrificans]|uniref:THUMP domain-containing protein n=1 Tax=Thiohalomonas denitrificans TaxID=415747 RepID=UPI0026EF804A|nr:THUMP domain-containing protein [Thiohalomonas denitrificans]
MREPWNVLVSISEGRYREAITKLRRFGTVHKTSFYSVLAVEADDPDAMLEELKLEQENNPEAVRWLGHIAPARDIFFFQSPEEFERKAREHVRPLLDKLAGKTFFVRIHRRGFKGRLSSQAEEQFLDGFILDTLREKGTPAAMDFQDPDFVIEIETLAQEAGLAVWSREQRKRYPFLKLH